MNSDTFVNVCIGALAISSVALTSIAVQRELRGYAAPNSVAIKVRNWKPLAEGGHRIGPRDARVVITEFGDFQCPYCARASVAIAKIVNRYAPEVALEYRHYPLQEIHPLALAAAWASECAEYQQRFPEFASTLYAMQDSIGAKSWTWFAERAGIRDLRSFRRCVRDTSGRAQVTKDIAAGDQLGVSATPTILINQYRLTGPPSPQVIDSLVQVAMRR